MRTFRLIVALVGGAALVTFAVQNTTPRLALVFLGGRTVALPLAVWLVGAIALGALTALALVSLAAVDTGACLATAVAGEPRGTRPRPPSPPLGAEGTAPFVTPTAPLCGHPPAGS
jgi:hypothetical protein